MRSCWACRCSTACGIALAAAAATSSQRSPTHLPPPLPAVTKQHVEIVLTAHPTQVNRRTLQHKHSRIAALLAQNDRGDMTQEERDHTLEELIRWA